MKYVKMIIAAIIILPLIGVGAYFAINSESIPFESVCVEGHKRYTDLCANVGKRAHSVKNVVAINDKDYGQIAGVAWRDRGSLISSAGQESRRSDSNSYYYIIKADKKSYYFLGIVNEIDPK